VIEWKEEIRRRLANLKLAPEREAEIVEELAQHMEDRYDELVALGNTDEAATRTALAELSESDLLTRELQRVERSLTQEPVVVGTYRGRSVMRDLQEDLRYGLRVLIKNPGFTAIAVLTIALGIGANTAIFSLVKAVLLRPLPYKDSERLVMVWEANQKTGVSHVQVSAPNYVDWRDQNEVFEQMAAAFARPDTGVNLTDGANPEWVQAAITTGNLFAVLGIQPALGRAFLPEEEKAGNNRVTILSDALWRRHFNGDRSIIGKTITLDARSYTVVGILPAAFEFPTPHSVDSAAKPKEPVELYLPAVLGKHRGGHNYRVIARLKPGVTLPQAQAHMDAIAARLQQQYPDQQAGMGASVVALSEQVVGKVRMALFVMLGAVGFVLLIACANIANLLLARSAERNREFAIRAALGASRSRIVRQVLGENLLLALAGGALGVLLAYWGVQTLMALSPIDFPRLHETRIDAPVFGFCFLLSIASGLVFGLAPAIQLSRPNLNNSLKDGGGRASEGLGHRRVRGFLIVSEVALSLVLLVGAGLLLRSFIRLQETTLGFDPARVLTMQLSLPGARYGERAQAVPFYEQLLQRTRNLPGVHSIGLTNYLPLSGSDSGTSFNIDGRPPLPKGEFLEAAPRWISPDYFRTMGVTIVQGRSLSEQDVESNHHVALINETMARRFWPGEDPLGKRITMESQENPIWHEIVGIVADVRHTALDSEAEPEMYYPYLFASEADSSPWISMYLVVRANSDDQAGLASALRREVKAVDKDQPVYNVASMTQLMSASVAQRRFNLLLVGFFAAVALVLAAVGLYGVMSYAVTQRTREIGVRLALGAQTHDVLKLVVKQGMKLTLVGIAIGLATACALTRLMKNLLFGVNATDPVTLAVVALLLILAALLACYIPARRATRVDPLVALRYE
jgi:putative ABC transport system permease protein